MEEEMHWLPTSIGMIVLACIFGGITLGIYPGMDVVGSFLKTNVKLNLSDKAADWVQAFGSIIAIWSGFRLSRTALRIQNEQQIERDRERDRSRERIQYCIMADVLNASEAWSAEIERKIMKIDGYELEREILIGFSVVSSLRSFTVDQIPSVEAVRRINMAVQSAEIVVANLNSLKQMIYMAADKDVLEQREATRLRSEHLRITSQVDKNFCNDEADRISTKEEVERRHSLAMNRAHELTRVKRRERP